MKTYVSDIDLNDMELLNIKPEPFFWTYNKPLNIILDDSGSTTIRDKNNPKNRAVGALIFQQDIYELNKKFETFLLNHVDLKQLLYIKQHEIKYEKIKRFSETHKKQADVLFCDILDFLVQNGCRFYWYQVRDIKKNINEEIEGKIHGKKFTKTIIDVDMCIIPNLIIIMKREGKKIPEFNIYCDFWTDEEFSFSVEGNGFEYYPSNSGKHLKNNDENYRFPVKKMKSSHLLHQVADIVAGIAGESLNRNNLESQAFQILNKNRFADIVHFEYT